LLTKIKAKTVYLPRKNFPFKQRVKIGDMIIKDGFVYWHYGVAMYHSADGMVRGVDEISNATVISDYDYKDGWVLVQHARPEMVTSILLRPEHRALSDMPVVSVILINVQEINKIRYGRFILSTMVGYTLSPVEIDAE